MGIGLWMFRRHTARIFHEMVAPINGQGRNALGDIGDWKKYVKTAYDCGSSETSAAAWLATSLLRNQLEVISPDARDKVLYSIKTNRRPPKELKSFVVVFIRICMNAPEFGHQQAYGLLIRPDLSAAPR